MRGDARLIIEAKVPLEPGLANSQRFECLILEQPESRVEQDVIPVIDRTSVEDELAPAISRRPCRNESPPFAAHVRRKRSKQKQVA
jgi:hypothetical protein